MDMSIPEYVCEDLCGNGVCNEIVCMAIGCPFARVEKSLSRRL